MHRVKGTHNMAVQRSSMTFRRFSGGISSKKKGNNESLSPSPGENKMLHNLMENFDQQKRKYEDDGAPVSRERVEKELNDALLSTAAIPISKDILDVIHILVNEGGIYNK